MSDCLPPPTLATIVVSLDVARRYPALMAELGLSGGAAAPAPKRVVYAAYNVTEQFVVPKGIDLNAEGVTWSVKWNTLEITLPDGKTLSVEGSRDQPNNFDWKRPSSIVCTDEEIDENHK